MKDFPGWLSLLFFLTISTAISFVIYHRTQNKDQLGQFIGRQLLNPEEINYPMALPELFDMQGRPQTIKSDRPVLLHFWATWCPSCLQELGSISNLTATFQEQLQIITVSVDENSDDLDKFLRENRFTLPLFRGKMPQSSLPVSYLLNKNGLACYRFTGTKPWGAPHAAQELDHLLKELP